MSMQEHKTRLLAMTQPLPGETSCENPEQLLAYFARVSSQANQDKHHTGPKLIKRLISKAEWSPLEMVNAVFEINTSRRVARQILRHSVLRPQEFSQRFAKVADEPFITEARMKHPTDRQMSVECDDQRLKDWWYEEQIAVWDRCSRAYNAALDKGMAKEVAVVVMPEGMSPSPCYFQGHMRGWLHYCTLRMKPETQKEHRLIAQSIWGQLRVHFPTLSEAVGDI